MPEAARSLPRGVTSRQAFGQGFASIFRPARRHRVPRHGGRGRAGWRASGQNTAKLRGLCLTGLLANESHLDNSGGEWVSDGDIVDVAFLVFAKKLGTWLTGNYAAI